MSPEAWVGLAMGIVTILTIVYQAGKIVSRLDTQAEAHEIQRAENEEAHSDLYGRVGKNDRSIARIEGRMHNSGGAHGE